MASLAKIPNFPLFLASIFLCFASQIHSLSTVSISTVSNGALICALIPSPNKQSFINCTSFPAGSFQNPIKSSNVSYSRIVGGNGFVCGLRSQSLSSSNSIMDCWRFSANETNILPKRVYKGPALSDFQAGNDHVCGLVNGSNALKCWQWGRGDSNPESESYPRFSSIAVGEDFVCGLGEKRRNITCLGKNASTISKGINRSRKYSLIAAGSQNLCAISLNGNLECSENTVGKKPNGDQFIDLALGGDRSCALRANGTVVCWGESDFQMPIRLQETYFTGIVARNDVFCGVVTSNLSLICWGNSTPSNGNDQFLVFPNVMPGHCTSSHCSCGPFPGYGDFCGQGLKICEPCSPSLPPQPPQSSGGSSSSSTKWGAKMVVLLVIGCLGVASFLAIIGFFVLRHRENRGSSRVYDSGPIDMGENPREPDHNDGLQGGSSGQPAPTPILANRLHHIYSMGKGSTLEEFPIELLLRVTDNFSPEHRMGIGSFGSVYRATLDDGRQVAIKRAEFHVSPTSPLGMRRGQEDKDSAFLAEIELLSRLNHKHLVRLHGFHEDPDERVLVYEFMSNGTLHDHLHKLKGSSPLASWPARLKVALDSARGIEYLHAYAQPPIIHRDIKPSNILLDQDWTAKVSDFGLSLMSPQEGETHISEWAAGTFGYVDPEYYRHHQLTTKSDVYSFGVVLLELLTGCKAVHTNEDGSHRNVVDFVVPYIIREEIHRVLDPFVPPPSPVEIDAVKYVGYLAAECLNPVGLKRPTMSEVIGYLEKAWAACLAPPSFSSSSTASSR